MSQPFGTGMMLLLRRTLVL